MIANSILHHEKISLLQTKSFSQLFIDYISQAQSLESFYGLNPTIENFKYQIEQKEHFFNEEKRKCLYNSLTRQYQGISCSDKVANNIASIKNRNAFTVVTGHQLNLFSGPLYFIYKLVTTIKLAKTIQAYYPNYNLVPMYWMASEDHDFKEINHFSLFGKEIHWQTDQKGAVGRFLLNDFKDVFEQLPEQIKLFEQAYTQHKNLAEATRYFVNELFGKYGLVIIDGDDNELKKSFSNILKKEIISQNSQKAVEKTIAKLETLGYKSQAHTREINLFYLDKHIRERIIKDEEYFQINNQLDLKFSEQELLQLIDEHPEKFSPNVILRPLYQEFILPNLAYIGGPSEVAYWLQLKGVFDAYDIPFPILFPRNFALIINKHQQNRLEKLNLNIEDLFLESHLLKKRFLAANTKQLINLDVEENEIESIFNQIEEKAIGVDKSLKKYVRAEAQRIVNALKKIEKKLIKSQEDKEASNIAQVERLREKLFPNNSLQEREVNFLNFYLNDPNFINHLMEVFDPFDFSFNIININ